MKQGCNFTYVEVDQTLRRPLAVLLFRNCCKRNCISKDNGQFQKAKLRRARRRSHVWSQRSSIPRLLRVTNGHSGSIPREPAQRAGLLRGDQVGTKLLVYAWFCYADVKNGKPFLELRWLRVILSTRGLYPLWLRITVISAHVEVFAVEAKLSGKNRRRRDLLRV